MPVGRIPQLDGIRGLAILSVVIWHYHGNSWQPLLLTWSGVDLFFVLSGFLIGGILLDNRQSRSYYSVFYIRRSFRILPLYLVAVMLGAMGIGVEEGQGNPSLIWYMLFTQNIWMAAHANLNIWLSPSWSLAVEEQFYSLIPLAVRSVAVNQLPLIVIGLVALSVLTRCSIEWFDSRSFGSVTASYVLLPCRMDSLLFGVLSAWALRQRKFRRYLSQNLHLAYFMFGALILSAAFMTSQKYGWDSLFMRTIGYTVLAALFACFLIIAVLETSGPVKSLTSLRILRVLGGWSYNIYLFHLMILSIAHRVIPTMGPPIGQKLTLLVSAAATIALAAFSSKYLEGPAIRFSHRWRYFSDRRAESSRRHARAMPVEQ